MVSCNGCDAIGEHLNGNGYCLDCQIEQHRTNEAEGTEACVFCGRPSDDLHAGDCVLALANDYADGIARPEYAAEARQAFSRLHAEGVL
jgi:hypothetical protein